MPPFRAIVVDDDDKEVPPGTEGRLFFEDATGRGIVYPGDPEKTAEAHLRPGVFTLGEIGYVTDDGFVYITDRFSDMIVSGGVNIYPAEAEQVLIEHPQVADVAVIGVPNRDMGEEVKALVVPADPADPPAADELIAWCRERLAGYKCPRSVDIVETVGRTAMGKVNKRELRRPFWERPAPDAARADRVAGRRDRARRRPRRAPSMSPRRRASMPPASGSIRRRGRRRRPPSVARRLAATGITPLDIEPVILGRGHDPADALVDTAAELGVGHVLVASGPAERTAVVAALRRAV